MNLLKFIVFQSSRSRKRQTQYAVSAKFNFFPVVCLSYNFCWKFSGDVYNVKASATTDQEKCIDYARHISHHHKTESYKTVDDPRGTWVSLRYVIIRQSTDYGGCYGGYQ